MGRYASKLDALEEMLLRIDDPAGQGSVVFTQVFREQARASAQTADELARVGVEQHRLAGMAISIKDLFDVQGARTQAGSRVLRKASAATHDASVVRRLRQCGAAIIGKTNMTEFAFSGLGINPHLGTPLSSWDRPTRRIPGGSSSGAAVAIADGMAWASIGTDTGGSCRIPAALNGIVGMKPTAYTVPRDGSIPLSASYDAVGPLAATVDDCALVYSAISGTASTPANVRQSPLRLGVIRNYVLEDLDVTVEQAFDAALGKLAKAGTILHDIVLPVLDDMPNILHSGGIVAAEAYEWHRGLLSEYETDYDPRVSVRIRRGSDISAADYIALLRLREQMVQRWTAQVSEFDAVLMPTVPIVAPRLDDLTDDNAYGRVNLLMLRNPTIVNVLDGCAISLPCHEADAPPVGLSVVGTSGRDWEMLNVARAIERVLRM